MAWPLQHLTIPGDLSTTCLDRTDEQMTTDFERRFLGAGQNCRDNRASCGSGAKRRNADTAFSRLGKTYKLITESIGDVKNTSVPRDKPIGFVFNVKTTNLTVGFRLITFQTDAK